MVILSKIWYADIAAENEEDLKMITERNPQVSQAVVKLRQPN